MNYQQVYLISVAVLLIGGAVCYLAGRKTAGPLAAVCSLAALALGFALWRAAPGELIYASFELPAGLAAAFVFKISGFTGFLNTMVLLFGFCVVLYSLSYWRDEQDGREVPRFYAFALFAVAGASVALLTRHMLVFVFAWEAVTAMLYLLIGTGGPKARAGGAKTFGILGFSDAALILAVALLYARGGAQAWNIDYLQSPAGRIAVTNWHRALLYLLFLTTALAKAGAVPLHTWVPAAAEGASVPTMALLPASLDKLLGIVLLARVSLGFFTLTPGLKMLLMVIGAVTILAGVMMAMVQHELKRLLSFHAISQVGYMVLGIGTGVAVGIVGGLFHMVNNAVYKTLLFLCGGAVEHETGSLELDRLGGLARTMPLTAVAFLTGALAISGVPPLNGFVSKWMVYQGAIEAGGSIMPLLLAAAVAGSALTLASFVKAMHSVFLGETPPALEGKTTHEAAWNMLFPFGVLSGLCVVLGLGGGYAARALFSEGLQEFGWTGAAPGAAQAALALSFKGAFWGPMQAVLLILVGLALGLIVYALGGVVKVRRVRPFLAGEIDPPGPTYMSGTGFYLTVRNLPFIKGIYGDAEREAFDGYRVTGKLGVVLVAALRKLHTGVLEVYVTWVVVGVAAVMALLFLLH